MWGWRRSIRGQLKIEGRRLDEPAPPLKWQVASRDDGAVGVQRGYLIFPTPGCWEVTGRVAGASLVFVTQVVKVGAGPSSIGDPAPETMRAICQPDPGAKQRLLPDPAMPDTGTWTEFAGDSSNHTPSATATTLGDWESVLQRRRRDPVWRDALPLVLVQGVDCWRRRSGRRRSYARAAPPCGFRTPRSLVGISNRKRPTDGRADDLLVALLVVALTLVAWRSVFASVPKSTSTNAA